MPTLPFCGNISTTKITGEITMNNKIKLIVTDDASEFTQENLNILQSKNISVIFCAKDGEELCDKIKKRKS